MACSSLASSADISPMATRSRGLMKPSLIRKPPARAIASRSGTAQWCSSRMRAAAESLGMSSSTSHCVGVAEHVDALGRGFLGAGQGARFHALFALDA